MFTTLACVVLGELGVLRVEFVSILKFVNENELPNVAGVGPFQEIDTGF
jgi:hypothetical protein